jgi:hypothetical protein
MLCLHPHGVFNLGLCLNGHEKFHCRMLASRMLLSLPIAGIWLTLWGVSGVIIVNFKYKNGLKIN